MGRSRTRGRGRLSAIDLLPEECSPLIAWAAEQLRDRSRSQVDIYKEWKEKLIALQGEIGLGFDIPSFKSFNNYSVQLAQAHRRMDFARKMAIELSDRFDAAGSDRLTQIGADHIKSLVLEIMVHSSDGEISPSAVKELALALRAAAAAEAASTARLMKIEAELDQRTEETIEKVAGELGLTKGRIAQLRRDFLGVRPKKKDDTE